MRTHKLGQLILILLALTIVSGFLIPSKSESGFTPKVPTPSWAQESQPRCGLATLCMLGAEVENVRINPYQWGLPADSHSDAITNIFKAYYSKTGRIPLRIKTTAELSNTYTGPYIWIGIFQNGGHICLCYFHTNYVTLKHGVYDNNTKTNMMTVWDYTTFKSNTSAVYLP